MHGWCTHAHIHTQQALACVGLCVGCGVYVVCVDVAGGGEGVVDQHAWRGRVARLPSKPWIAHSLGGVVVSGVKPQGLGLLV